MSTDTVRTTLNGATMGTRWSAVIDAPRDMDQAPLPSALQRTVDAVDTQMSTWSATSDLMRLNAAPVGIWQTIPAQLMAVLRIGCQIGAASSGAFDIGMGDVVTAWGFGPDTTDPDAIRAAMAQRHGRTHDVLDLDPAAGRIRKLAPVALDLNGIAKGYGTDRLAETLVGYGLTAALVGIDGEMRSIGAHADGTPWSIAIEAPDFNRRAPHAILDLTDAAVATSGDYRHWVTVKGRRLSHTMDPVRRAPLLDCPASVTVVAPDCASADAWATALMVLGADAGQRLAQDRGLDALFLMRGPGDTVQSAGVGPLFATSGQ